MAARSRCCLKRKSPRSRGRVNAGDRASLWNAALGGGGGAPCGAVLLLSGEAQGLAVDFTDMSMVIRDTGTPANDFDDDPNDKLSYTH